MRRYSYIIAAVLFAAFASMLSSAYYEVRTKTIAEFNAQQKLMAQQAAVGIEQYFGQYRSEQNYLTRLPEIIDFNDTGRQLMQLYFDSHGGDVKGITRMSAEGRIVYTIPFVAASIGADISQQPHIRTLLSTHQPVVSEVFTTVQGYDAVAYHVPVFDGEEFAGSVALLIPFDLVAKKYIENIRPATSGYAWVISRQGVELYCQSTEHIGLPFSETAAQDPQFQAMAAEMMAGWRGTAEYRFHFTHSPADEYHKFHAAFCPIDLGNTYWSIAVATPESEVLATMTGFRNRFMIVLGLLVLSSLAYVYILIRSWVAVREAEYRRQVAADKERLTRQYTQAQKLEAVGRLAAGVAHDLNNLLTPILGYTEMLMDELGAQAPAAGHLDGIKRAGLRARDLVQQLLTLGRKQAMAAKPVSLHEVIGGLEPFLRRTIREDIEICLKLEAAQPVISGDVSYLERAILNLAINAQDAMPEGGRLLIETANVEIDAAAEAANPGTKAGKYVRLNLSDTGQGIPPEIRDKIFDPFFTTKEQGKGTGLGLASVHGIVTQHGGFINVYSENGHGTVFKLYFPEAQAVASLPVAPVEAYRDTTGSETIVVVEDNDMVRSLAARVLGRQGYTVHTFATPADCLAGLPQLTGEIALLLTDVVMPGMNGKELYAQVVAQFPRIKVLYMSGYTDYQSSQPIGSDFRASFIQKPFSIKALSEKVRAILDALSPPPEPPRG